MVGSHAKAMDIIAILKSSPMGDIKKTPYIDIIAPFIHHQG